jgi:hypothetical protein
LAARLLLDGAARTSAIPRACRLNVTIPKIAEIYGELRSLRLGQHPHAIAVLLRVFLETSVDHYLTKVGVPLITKTAGGDRDKILTKKVEEAIDELVKHGATKKDFAGVVRALSVKAHPLSVDLLHAYVHNRFVSPTERDLTVAWDNAQPLFERERALLVLAHQPRIAGDIDRQNGRQPSLDPPFAHLARPVPQEVCG